MIAVKIAALVVGVIALFLTFRPKQIIENLLRKEATEEMILRVKYVALALAIIAFLAVFLIGR